jgi:hydroxymethylbilane synthase
VLRAATRGSPLARLQTGLVADMLGVPVEPVIIDTRGDQVRDVPIHAIAGQGVFVKEVQQAVLDGRADFAVHSAKDLTSTPTDGLVIAAVPEREDPRDVLVGARLYDIPPGGRVATGSVRRRAQLAGVRPDLTWSELRGNIDTRLAKAANHHAIVMAAAALHRLGRADVIAETLDPLLLMPQVAQGALAVECRADDAATFDALSTIDHRLSHLAIDAERSFLAALGGGCDVPAGALATVGPDGEIHLRVMLATLDGHVVLRADARGTDPAELGAQALRRLSPFPSDAWVVAVAQESQGR